MKKTRPAWWIEGVNAPDTPVPWHEIDPFEEVWPEDPEEPGYGELSPTLGPASRSGAPPYNPMSVQGPGIDPGGYSLIAAELNWRV